MITIIVLLILAGVSIAMLTGENGILNKATTAKENTVAADEKEKVSLAYNDVLADKLDGTSSGDITVAEMEQALERQGVDNTKASVEKINGEDKIKVTFIDTNHEYEVNTKINGGTTGTTPTTIQPSTYYLGLREGDKVIYTYNGTQIPCTVLYDADPSRSYASDNYGVQIIADDTVGDGVQFGNGTGSDSTDATYFATVGALYNDAIGILNRTAESYINTDLAIDARCVGSVPNDKNSRNTAKYTRNDEWFTSYNNQLEAGEEVSGYTSNYIIDKTKMDTLGITNIGKIYWLASRCTYGESSVFFVVRWIWTGGQLDESRVLTVSSNGSVRTSSNTERLRPVFTLRPDVKVVYGENNTKVLTKGD